MGVVALLSKSTSWRGSTWRDEFGERARQALEELHPQYK